MKKLLTGSITAAFAIAFIAAPNAYALHNAEHYALFGDAAYVSPGNASNRAVDLVSDPGFSGIDYGVEEGTTFADLTTLSTDFKPESDDTCLGGSPRFQINLTDPVSGDEGNVFVYLGTDSASLPCVPGVWQNSGDLLEVTKLVDTSQLGGTFYQPYALALAQFGTYEVTGIQLVVDASWAFADSEQAVQVDNTMINSTLFTYEVPVPSSKDECKNGGWMTMGDDSGRMFKNQGDCVSYSASKGKNKAAGI